MVANIGKLTTRSVAKAIPGKELAPQKNGAKRSANKAFSKKTAAAPTAEATPRSRQAADARATAAKSRPGKGSGNRAVTPEERHGMIATAAYFHAEQRGFTQGYELEDWMFGEAEIDSRLRLK